MTLFFSKFRALFDGSLNVTRGALNLLLRWFYICVGCFFVGLAILGVYLPLLPTVPFALIAAGCFVRSSPRLYNWLRNLKFIGPMLRDWQDHKRISLRSKKIATVSIVLSFSYSIYSVNPLVLKIFLVSLAVGISMFIWTRKSE